MTTLLSYRFSENTTHPENMILRLSLDLKPE